MKNSRWILIFTFLLTLSIYASPTNDSLEIAATFCHFSDTAKTCSCPEEAKENRDEQAKSAAKVRRYSCRSVDESCTGSISS